MTPPRPSRFRLAAILIPVIALALASFWVLEVMRRGGDNSAARADRTEPDFYVEQFNYVKLARTGQAQYHVSGARLTHNPVNGSYTVTAPVVRSMRENAEPMVITAKSAWINADSSEVHLIDDVVIDRPAASDDPRMQLHTQRLIVLPDDDAMRTDLPVKINHGHSVLTGTGMVANNATGEFTLLANVHGSYQPPPR